MLRVLTRSIALVATLLVASPCLSAADAPVQLTIATAVDGFQYTPLYVAKANGYFDAEGLAVQLLPLGGGSKAMSAMLAGSADVAAGGASEVLNAANHGQHVVAFATLAHRPAASIVLQRDVAERLGVNLSSPLQKRIAALQGLKIGISAPRSAVDSVTRTVLAAGHLDPDRDVELVPLGGSDGAAAAFLAHRIDAVTYTSPVTEEALLRGNGVELFNIANGEFAEYREYPWAVLSAKKDWLDANPRVVRGLVRALARAEHYVQSDPDGTKKILRAVFSQLDDAAFNEAFRRNMPAVPGDPSIKPASFAGAFTEFAAVSTDKLTITADQIATNAYVAAAK